MSFSKGKAVTGKNWKFKLVHVEYDGDGKITARHEFFNLNHLLDDGGNFAINYSPPAWSQMRAKITKISVLAYDLGLKDLIKPFVKLWTHHFIRIDLQSGFVFTLEKNKDCIVMQSCPPPADVDTPPIVTFQRDGKPRNNRKSLETLITEKSPTVDRILDIVKYIHEKGELFERYDLTGSNCQDFCRSVWHPSSKQMYPNPSKYCQETAKFYVGDITTNLVSDESPKIETTNTTTNWTSSTSNRIKFASKTSTISKSVDGLKIQSSDEEAAASPISTIAAEVSAASYMANQNFASSVSTADTFNVSNATGGAIRNTFLRRTYAFRYSSRPRTRKLKKRRSLKSAKSLSQSRQTCKLFFLLHV